MGSVWNTLEWPLERGALPGLCPLRHCCFSCSDAALSCIKTWFFNGLHWKIDRMSSWRTILSAKWSRKSHEFTRFLLQRFYRLDMMKQITTDESVKAGWNQYIGLVNCYPYSLVTVAERIVGNRNTHLFNQDLKHSVYWWVIYNTFHVLTFHHQRIASLSVGSLWISSFDCWCFKQKNVDFE